MIHSRVGSPSVMRRRLLAAALLLAGALGALGVLGSTAAPALAAPGALDGGFGSGGVFFAPTSSTITRQGYATAIQRDGKIVVAGIQRTLAAPEPDLALWRLTPDGALDPTFNGSGFTTLNLTGNQYGNAVAIDALGRIVVAGRSYMGDDDEFLLARFTPAGMLDTTFNGTGYLTIGFGTGTYDYAYGLAIQKDGKIVAAGESYGTADLDFALARCNPDGSLDSTFGSGDGLVSTDFGRDSDDSAFAVAIQNDGRIVLAGETAGPTDRDFALARYRPDGALDLSFDLDGLVTANFGSSDAAAAVAIQPDGKIVAAGSALVAGQWDFALVRYQKNGRPDPSFDQDGKLTTDFGQGKTDVANALALQKNGKLVVVGRAQDGAGAGEYSFALARFGKNGSLDPKFGMNGRLVTMLSAAADLAYSVAIQRDSKYVVAGSVGNTMAVARYLAH